MESMEPIENLTDEELMERFAGWRLPPTTASLPHNPDIEAASLAEFEGLRREVLKRGLLSE